MFDSSHVQLEATLAPLPQHFLMGRDSRDFICIRTDVTSDSRVTVKSSREPKPRTCHSDTLLKYTHMTQSPKVLLILYSLNPNSQAFPVTLVHSTGSLSFFKSRVINAVFASVAKAPLVTERSIIDSIRGPI